MITKLIQIFVIVLFIDQSFCHQSHSPDQKVSAHHEIDKDHVLEHLEGVINKPKDQMTPEEQNFYYFKLHDYDNNNMLDGLELVNAFAHNDVEHHNTNETGNQEASTPPPTPRMSDDELVKIIDEIMRDEDKNNDGYITYQEFLTAVKA